MMSRHLIQAFCLLFTGCMTQTIQHPSIPAGEESVASAAKLPRANVAKFLDAQGRMVGHQLTFLIRGGTTAERRPVPAEFRQYDAIVVCLEASGATNAHVTLQFYDANGMISFLHEHKNAGSSSRRPYIKQLPAGYLSRVTDWEITADGGDGNQGVSVVVITGVKGMRSTAPTQ